MDKTQRFGATSGSNSGGTAHRKVSRKPMKKKSPSINGEQLSSVQGDNQMKSAFEGPDKKSAAGKVLNNSDSRKSNISGNTNKNGGAGSYHNMAEHAEKIAAKQKKEKAKQAEESAKKKVKPQQLMLCTSQCRYNVIKRVCRQMDFKLTDDENADWDLFWSDTGVQLERVSKLQPYQRINFSPGIQSLSLKNNLARNLMRLNKVFKEEYDFFPKTWVLPSEAQELKAQFNRKKTKTFIIKPVNMCQGRGIYLTRRFEDIDMKSNDQLVAQRYMHKPYLIDGLKFDLRVYVLIYGVDPLRVYVFNEGIARFATEPYTGPYKNNLDNLYMHLTNYAINKNSGNFVKSQGEDDDVGHKRSMTSILQHMEENEPNFSAEKMMDQIEDIAVKTVIAGQPSLSHSYRTCQPDDLENSICFQILGIDIIFDSTLKPYLLEVNHLSSFGTDSPLDKKIKYDLIYDTFNLLNLSMRRKKKTKKDWAEQFSKRLHKEQRLTKVQKEEIRYTNRCERDYYDNQNLGNFRASFPARNPNTQAKYEAYMQEAKNIFNKFTTSHRTTIPEPRPPNDYAGRQPPTSQFGSGTNPNTNTNPSNNYAIKLSSVPVPEKPKASDLISNARLPIANLRQPQSSVLPQHQSSCPIGRQNSSTMRHTSENFANSVAMQTPNRRSKHAHSLAPDGQSSSNQYTHVTAPTTVNNTASVGRPNHFSEGLTATEVALPGGQGGIYTSGNKHRQHYQQHINNYLADTSGTYYVMRGSSDQLGQAVALVQPQPSVGILPPGGVIQDQKRSAQLKAMIDQAKNQMGGHPAVLRTPVKVQNGQILVQNPQQDSIAKKYPFIKLDSSTRVTNQTSQQKNLVLYAADNKLLKQYNQQNQSKTNCSLTHPQPNNAAGANVNPACPLHGHHGHSHGEHRGGAKGQQINSCAMGTLPQTGSTVINYNIPDLNRSLGQQASTANVNVSSPDKHRQGKQNGSNTFSKMTTDSTDATQTFSATSGQPPNASSTVYSASAIMRNSEQNVKSNQVLPATNDPNSQAAEPLSSDAVDKHSLTALKAGNSKSEVGSRMVNTGQSSAYLHTDQHSPGGQLISIGLRIKQQQNVQQQKVGQPLSNGKGATTVSGLANLHQGNYAKQHVAATNSISQGLGVLGQAVENSPVVRRTTDPTGQQRKHSDPRNKALASRTAIMQSN